MGEDETLISGKKESQASEHFIKEALKEEAAI